MQSPIERILQELRMIRWMVAANLLLTIVLAVSHLLKS
jgi:hypothetical protein